MEKTKWRDVFCFKFAISFFVYRAADPTQVDIPMNFFVERQFCFREEKRKRQGKGKPSSGKLHLIQQQPSKCSITGELLCIKYIESNFQSSEKTKSPVSVQVLKKCADT